LPLLVNIVLKLLVTAISQEKEIKASRLERNKENYLYSYTECSYREKTLKNPPKRGKNIFKYTINELSKVAGSKINVQPSVDFCTLAPIKIR
jgi:hypothetical protein